ncbi:hypothetical protein J6590_034774 [Homalodisca vitripennis]|nr:hypothetical protein J6590_034774 [Homalodisca vitripennis]
MVTEELQDDPHCISHIHKFYRQMKCQPEMSPHSKCPTSYKCPNIEDRSPEHCYWDGNKYPIGHNITGVFHPPCTSTCQCVRLHEGVRFKCDQKGDRKSCKSDPGCKNFGFYDDFHCCEKRVTSCNQGKQVQCQYDGRTYNEGEIFFTSEDITCSQCICVAGFNGTIAAPWCQKLSCVLELWGETPEKLTQGCIPVYITDSGCCPIAFRCPKPSDDVIKAENKTSAETDKTCQFGNLTMEVGDRLSPWNEARGTGKNAECICEVPPLASCIVQQFLTEDIRRKLAREDLDWTKDGL